MQVLTELEKIDDDCDKHGIQFVKIDDHKAAKEFGIDSIPSIVYFEKQLPNVYDGKVVIHLFFLFSFFRKIYSIDSVKLVIISVVINYRGS
jgi:hypothetical protein